jgi:hypothetical protein
MLSRKSKVVNFKAATVDVLLNREADKFGGRDFCIFIFFFKTHLNQFDHQEVLEPLCSKKSR